ncbi:MAG: hypothetical protein U0694_26395 [Anaerolineae bacterium]
MTVTITVTNANLPPTDQPQPPNSVAQNASVGLPVGTLTATDPDTGETFTFSGSNAPVQCQAQSTVLVAGAPTAGAQSIDVTVTDGAGNTYSETLPINVTTVNQAPTDINPLPNSVAQNASSNPVGTLTASDPDAGETFTFSGGSAQFFVKAQSVLVAGTLTAGAQTLDVTVTDSAANTFTKTPTINVTTVNQAPTDINLTPSSVAQNASAGTPIGTLTATDPDAGETFSFSGGNAQFSVSGNQVLVAGTLTAGAQTLDVTVTDSAANTFTKTLTINVATVNQPPTGISLSPSAIAQNASVGAVVGTLTAVDLDAGETFTFSGGNAQFSVSGNQVTVAGGLTAGTQTLDVTVTDSAAIISTPRR